MKNHLIWMYLDPILTQNASRVIGPWVATEHLSWHCTSFTPHGANRLARQLAALRLPSFAIPKKCQDKGPLQMHILYMVKKYDQYDDFLLGLLLNVTNNI